MLRANNRVPGQVERSRASAAAATWAGAGGSPSSTASRPLSSVYRARNERHDPVGVLRRKRRGDAGAQASMIPALRQALLAQYGAHKSWSAQLHHDNLAALAETRPELRPVPSLRDGPVIPRRQRAHPAPCRDHTPDRGRAGVRGPA